MCARYLVVMVKVRVRGLSCRGENGLSASAPPVCDMLRMNWDFLIENAILTPQIMCTGVCYL